MRDQFDFKIKYYETICPLLHDFLVKKWWTYVSKYFHTTLKIFPTNFNMSLKDWKIPLIFCVNMKNI